MVFLLINIYLNIIKYEIFIGIYRNMQMQTQEERRKFILNQLALSGRVYVNELAEMTGVSIETARRDIQLLHDNGLLKKVHGGAVKTKTIFQAAFSERLADKTLEKSAIGQKATELIHNGDSIFIDCGSTTCAFASCLAVFYDLTVITNSPLIAHTVWECNSNLRIYMIGGQYSGSNHQNLGSRVISQISQFKADIAFIGASGVSISGGITAAYLEEAEIAIAMLKHSNKAVVLADNNKINKVALCQISSIYSVANIITNDLDNKSLLPFKEKGINITSINTRNIHENLK